MKPLEKLFAQTHILPTVPRIVSELIASLQDPDIDLDEFIDKLRLDQVLTAKVLRLANSAHYGLSRKVGNIHEAISLVGFDQLRTLIIACGMAGVFTKVPGIDLDTFWRKSLLTALIGQDLAKKHKIPEEQVFTTSLLSQIGILLIHLAYPDEGKIIAQNTQGQCPLARCALETQLIGLDYCTVSAELVKRWNFPENMALSVAFHATPNHPQAGPYATILWQATWLAFLCTTGTNTQPTTTALAPPTLAELGLDDSTFAEQSAAYRELAQRISSIF